jgi:hypothetical protein
MYSLGFKHVIQEQSTAPRSTATLMKTGQTTSYRTGDDGDIEAGRDVDFFTLDAAPLHNDGSATLNTTTARFTDTLGGSTYADDIVLDWSTWNGSTLLGYYLGDASNRTWNDYIDWALVLSIGTFTTGWRSINVKEMTNLWQYSTNRATNYSPFNGGFFTLNIATSSRFFGHLQHTLQQQQMRLGWIWLLGRYNQQLKLILINVLQLEHSLYQL